MGYERYRSNAQKIRRTTAPVKITDIIVAPSGVKPSNGNYLGEFEIPTDNPNLSHTGKSALERIEDHIKLFSKMANREHEKANFQQNLTTGDMEIKPDKGNEVTRLSFNEFTFYPKDRPLTLDEYRSLLEKIKDIAAGCHENFHLLLASFPVEWPDKKVYNIVVHVQCGKAPVLNSFAKAIPSSIDALYPGTTNPSFTGSSYYPKVLNEGITLTGYTDKIFFDNVVTWTTNGLWTPDLVNTALQDTKTALLADKYTQPSQSLINCLDDCILTTQGNVPLTNLQIKTYKEEMEKFKVQGIEQSIRFGNAANLVLPRPDIIPNGISTNHYGQYSFQQIIDYIKSCDGNIVQSAQAKEILETTKRSLETIATENPTYPTPTNLVSHIDSLLLRLPGNALTTIEVDGFKNEMEQYKTACQNKYNNDFKLVTRPEIVTRGIQVSGMGFFTIDTIRDGVEANSVIASWTWAKKLLEAVRDNILQYNANNAIYAPDSTALLVHINNMLPQYVPPFNPLNPNEFNTLAAELENYRVACESRYQTNVRPIIPQIAKTIGKTAGHAEAKSLDEIAVILKSNLDDPTKLNVARDQLDYLRVNLLFTAEERSLNTQHSLLKEIDKIMVKLDKQKVVEQSRQYIDSFKTINTALTATPPSDENMIKINQCAMMMNAVLADLSKHFPGEDTITIREKIGPLLNKLPYNPTSDLETFKGMTPLEMADLQAFEEGYNLLSQLIQTLPNKVKIEATDSDNLKLAIESYNAENLPDKLEKLIDKINLRLQENRDHQEFSSHLLRMLSYLKNIETLSLDSKKAITAITDKLNTNQPIDNSLKQELTRALTVDNALVAKMPYWLFPLKTYSEDVPYNYTVLCRTHGQGEFWTNSHICLDHRNATGLRSFYNSASAEMVPPLHFSELVTSDSVPIEKAHTINPQGVVSHADVVSIKFVGTTPTTNKSATKLRTTLMGARNLATESTLGLNQLTEAATTPLDAAYLTTLDTSDTDQVIVNKPPFGPDCVMRKYDTHQLFPIPISPGVTASSDTYTTNYYVRKLEAVMNAFQLPPNSPEQEKFIKEFMKKLLTLKNNNSATGEDFYKLLKEFKTQVESEKNEKTYPLLRQINAMGNYLDKKLLSPESFIILRVLSPLGNAATVDQNSAESELKLKLEQISQQPLTFDLTTGLPIIPAKDIADAVVAFRKKIVELEGNGEDVTQIKEKCKSAERYLREQYPEVHHEMTKVHFPVFSKTIPLVSACLEKPFVDTLSEEKIAALKKLEDALKKVQMNELDFDKNGRSILDLFTVKKAWEEFTQEINNIKDQDTTDLDLMKGEMNSLIVILESRREALNLGEEYYLAQIELLKSKSDAIQKRIDTLNQAKDNSSLQRKKQWAPRVLETQKPEEFINASLEKLFEEKKINVESTIGIMIKDIQNTLEDIKGNKESSQKMLISEIANVLLRLKRLSDIDFTPEGNIKKAYQDILKELEKEHYHALDNELKIVIERDLIKARHEFLDGYHDSKKSTARQDLKDKVALEEQALTKMKARPEKIEEELIRLTEEKQIMVQQGKERASKLEEAKQQLHVLSEEKRQMQLLLDKQHEKDNSLLSEIQILKHQHSDEKVTLEKMQQKALIFAADKKQLETMKSEFVNEQSKLLIEMRKAGEKLEDISARTSSIKDEKINLEKNISQQEAIYSELLRSAEQKKSTLDSLNNQMKSLDKRCEEYELQVKHYENNIVDLQKRIAAFGVPNETNQSDIAQLNTRIQELNKLADLYREEYRKADEKRRNLPDQVFALETERHEILQKADDMVDKNRLLREEANSLGSNLGQLMLEHKGLSQDLGLMKEKNLTLDKKVEEAENDLDAKIREISLLEVNILQQETKVDDMQRIVDSKEKENVLLGIEIERTRREVDELSSKIIHQTEEVENQSQQLDEHNLSMKSLDNQVDQLSNEKAELKIAIPKKEEEVNALKEQVINLDTNYQVLDSQMERHEEQQSRIESDIQGLQKSKQEIDEMQEHISSLKK